MDSIRHNYRQTLWMEELAASVKMSPSTFHQHFKPITAMSPLQHQKWLRLGEARRLMLSEHQDISSSAFAVGYKSPSQFSREYGHLFGASPKADIEELRRAASQKEQTIA